MSERKRRCPQCGRELEENGAFFPFCSRRCRMIDLGRWLGEAYRIPGEPVVRTPDAD